MFRTLLNKLIIPACNEAVCIRNFMISPQNLESGGTVVTKHLDTLEKSFNQVILIGRVGNNPEERGSEQNPAVTFSLATNNYYTKNEEMIQQTDWHRVTVFKPSLRERIMKYMTKGNRVMVNGRINYFERKDADSIIVKNATIIADDIIFFARANN